MSAKARSVAKCCKSRDLSTSAQVFLEKTQQILQVRWSYGRSGSDLNSIQLFHIKLPHTEIYHYDISWGVLEEAKDLAKRITIPGSGDSKTVCTMILCSVAIEGALNYAYRIAGLLAGYGDEQVLKYLEIISIRSKLALVLQLLNDSEKKAITLLYERVTEGVEPWAVVGKNRARLVHPKGEHVPMSINQARAMVSACERILQLCHIREASTHAGSTC